MLAGSRNGVRSVLQCRYLRTCTSLPQFFCVDMADRLDKRKNAFKTKNLNSTDRIRKESEQARKEKRSTNVLAKRLRADPAAADESQVFADADVNSAITQVKSGEHGLRVEGLRLLREILCSTNSSIELIVNSGTPVYLSSMLGSPNEEIRVEAAWCLTNIATGDHEQTGSVLCAVPYMVEILSSSRDSVELKEQICWAIGNIAGDCDEHRQVLHGNGCLPAVLKFLEECVADAVQQRQASSQQGSGSALRTAAWTLSNMARGKVSGQCFQDTGKLPQLLQWMDSRLMGSEGAEEMWWLFAFLTAKEDAVVAHCMQLGLVQILVEQLGLCTVSALCNIPLIRCLGNISSGPIEWMDSIVSTPGLLEQLLCRISYHGLLAPAEGHVHKLVVKETLWVVCNILGALPCHRKALLLYNTSNLHPCVALEHLMATIRCDEFDVQQEGVFCLEQACADEDLLHLLLVSSVYRPQLLPLARQLGRLLRSPSCDVPLSCMRIVGALTAAAKDMDKMNKQNGSSNCNTSSGGLMELVNLWVEAGITEALDDIQYSGAAAGVSAVGDGAGAGAGGPSVGEGAAALVELLYAVLEQDEQQMADVGSVGSCGDNSGGTGGGGGVPQQQQPQQMYTFGANVPVTPTVFSFGPAADTSIHSLHQQQSQSQGQGQGIGLGGGGAGQSGAGRGSHLNKPAWMT